MKYILCTVLLWNKITQWCSLYKNETLGSNNLHWYENWLYKLFSSNKFSINKGSSLHQIAKYKHAYSAIALNLHLTGSKFALQSLPMFTEDKDDLL